MGLLRALVGGSGERGSSPATLVGVLNRTPDSFSDGGDFVDDARAFERALAMIAEGAKIIDVGAESTRPGSTAVSAQTQIARIGSVIRRLREARVVVSVDTTSPEVARWALDEGAQVVNSVELAPAAELGRLAAERGAALILMHSRGSMAAMPGFSVAPDDAYGDVVEDVWREWSEAARRALDAGLPREALLLDPGFGFHKNANQSLELCARLGELCAKGYDVVAGPSRKSFVARAGLGPSEAAPPPSERVGGTIAACLACARGGARFLRVHDVAAVAQALRVERAITLASRPRAALLDGAEEGGARA